MEKYLDPGLSPRERALDLLGRMSVAEKMAQTRCTFLRAHVDDAAREACRQGMGSISALDAREMGSAAEVAAAVREFQELAMAQSPHHIPATFHMEGLCGPMAVGTASFPAGIGRGASFDPELEEKIGELVGRQERALGITQTLAPVLDVSRDARFGRHGEPYGEDPMLVAAMGSAFARGGQGGEPGGRRTDCVAKHFLGFHNGEAGIHGAASNTPPRLLREVYGRPFQAAITTAGLKGVMPCYCSFDGEAAHTSSGLLTTLLRDEMGFAGLVVSDYSGVSNAHRVDGLFESDDECGYQALLAGMDCEWPQTECFDSELERRFESGELPLAALDASVARILESKFRMGLFEDPFPLEGAALEDALEGARGRELSRRSAEESLVLLKNDGALPLEAGALKKVAVVGPHAANPRSFFGGYTLMSMSEACVAAANSIAGVGEHAEIGFKEDVKTIPGTQVQSDETPEFDAVLARVAPDCPSLADELARRLPGAEVVYAHGYPVAGDDRSGFDEALAAMEDADVCIVTLGGKHGSCSVATMGEGVDSVDENLPECQDAFLRAAAQTGVPLVGVHLDGRAISSDAADEALDAILEAWSPSEAGAGAIADVLLGDANPSGKLPVSVAWCAAQEPLYYNHPKGSSWHQGASIGFTNYVNCPHTPRYFFGHGLSYTTFEYARLKVAAAEVEAAGTVEVAFTLTNTGQVAGTEVAQLYVSDRYASMVRPCMELAGFRRVSLEPGESARVSFTLAASQLAFIDAQMRWKVEAGDIDLMVGSSSADIRLRGSVRIANDAFIDPKARAFWA